MPERDSDIRALSVTSNPQVGENLIRPPTMTRDGALFSADWYLKQLLRGRIFQVAGGATDQGLTDPGTWAPGAIVATEFDLLVNVPLNTTIIPLQWTIVYESFSTTGLAEIVLNRGTGAVAGANGVTLTPVNQNSGSSRTSSLAGGNVQVNMDAAGTAITQVAEIYRGGLQLVEDIAANDNAAWPNRFEWNASAPGDLHIIQGAHFMAGFIGATQGTGFQKLVYAEFETGEDIG